MSPTEVEGNSFVKGFKPVCYEGDTGFFKSFDRFSGGFSFVIAFPVDYELAFLAIDLIVENLFNFPFFLSYTINGNSFFGGRIGESWEGLEVWSEINSKVAAMDPRVQAFHDRWKVEFVVIVFVRSFRNRNGSKPWSHKFIVSSYCVYIAFEFEGNFGLFWGDGWSFFASLFSGLGLASACLVEGVSGELLVSHHLRSYVIGKGKGGREDFNTW